MADESLRHQAMSLLNTWQAQWSAQDVEEAIGFTERHYDPETGRTWLYGFYADPVEAMAAASASVERNATADLGDVMVTVELILPNTTDD